MHDLIVVGGAFPSGASRRLKLGAHNIGDKLLIDLNSPLLFDELLNFEECRIVRDVFECELYFF